MKQALRQLLSDFLSAILFLVVYAVSGSLFAAAGIAVAAGLAQLARLRLTRRRIEPMQWMSLGLVVVLGGATMLTQSPRFIMIKPTIVHFAVATVMLRRGWMLPYLPEIVLRNVPEPAERASKPIPYIRRGSRNSPPPRPMSPPSPPIGHAPCECAPEVRAERSAFKTSLLSANRGGI